MYIPGRMVAFDWSPQLAELSLMLFFSEFTNMDHSFEEVVYSREHASLLVLLKTHEG